MSSIKIEFEAPDGTTYSVEKDDARTRTLADEGLALLEEAVEAIKRAAGLVTPHRG